MKNKISVKRILATIFITIAVWVPASELIFPGILEKTVSFIVASPLSFSLVIIAPFISFFAMSQVWRTILSLYSCKKNPLNLTKYVMADFGISFLVPSLGAAGRLARAGLLITSGVRPAIAFSSVVIDGIIFAIQGIAIIGVWIILSYLRIISFGPEILLIMETWFTIALSGITLIILLARFRLIGKVTLIIGKKSRRLANLLKEVNESFAKIFSMPKLTLLSIAGWVGLWYLGGILEIWLIANLIGFNLSWEVLLLMQLIASTLSIIVPSPMGFGTMELFTSGVFIAFKYDLAFAAYLIIMWRIRNLIYSGIGIGLAGESLLNNKNNSPQ